MVLSYYTDPLHRILTKPKQTERTHANKWDEVFNSFIQVYSSLPNQYEIFNKNKIIYISYVNGLFFMQINAHPQHEL